MGRKVRIELDPDIPEEEVIIRCPEITPEILKLQKLAEGDGGQRQNAEISLSLGDREYFVAVKNILFFETSDSRTAAHTSDRMYYTDKKLFELSEFLPSDFMRVSKSCIVNLQRISSIRRDVTGVCEVFFEGSEKRIYVSRMYYKPFREKLLELRIRNQ